jgi:hypothetical protein
MSLKEKLHNLIDSCNDETTLQDTIQLLEQSLDKSDWWNQLPEQEKATTQKALQESQNGNTISQQNMQQKIWSKFGK